jgi:predicted enzyme related to lactoylglutathione lyase
MGRVVHFEIPSADPEKASGFYRDLFGWQIQDAGVGMPYFLAKTGEEEPGIDGAIMGNDGTAKTVVNTIGVESLDTTLAKVKELGGQVVTDIMPIPGVGTFAYCKDLDGNLFGVLQAEMPG